jgi:adenylylsulfate kinase-like enzyme
VAGPNLLGTSASIGEAAAVPAVYQLLGFPGTGKYTVAKAIVAHLAARGEPAALLDNHSTANLVWSLVEPERRFDPDVMARLAELRSVLWDAAAELTSPARSLVLTNYLPIARAPTAIDRHRQLAQQLDRPFVAVVLRCDPEEVLRRVANADRAARLKVVDPVRARAILAEGMTLPTWPELVDLDITGLTPAEAAARVVALADAADGAAQDA